VNPVICCLRPKKDLTSGEFSYRNFRKRHIIRQTLHYISYHADQEAPDAAQNIMRGKVSASEILSVNDAYKIAKDIPKKSWQRKWNEESTGRHTYDLLPDVCKNVTFPRSRNVGVSYCRMLLHDTFLNDDGYRTGILDTSLCSCGEEKESVEHVLLRCCQNEEARTVMLDSLSDIFESVQSNQKLDIT